MDDAHERRDDHLAAIIAEVDEQGTAASYDKRLLIDELATLLNRLTELEAENARLAIGLDCALRNGRIICERTQDELIEKSALYIVNGCESALALPRTDLASTKREG